MLEIASDFRNKRTTTYLFTRRLYAW